MTVFGVPARVAAAPFVVSVVVVLPIMLIGALFVEYGPEFDLERSALGLLAAVFLVVSILVAPGAGRFSDRFGAGQAIVVAAMLAAVACGGIAVIADSGPGLVPWLVVAGLSNAIGQPATALFVLDTIPQARQGLAFGVKNSTAPLGTLLAGIAVPAVALTVGWRWAFSATAVLAVLAALAVPRSDRAARPTTALRGLGGLPRRDVMIRLVVAMMLGVSAASVLGLFFVDATVDAGFSRATAGVLQAVGSGLGASARLVAGWIADRRASVHLRLVSVMLACGSLGYVLLGITGDALVVVGTMLAFALGWGWVGVFFFAIARLNPEAPGVATGIVQIGDFAGSLAGPVLFGALAAGRGYRTAWFAAAALALAGAGVTISAAVRTGRHDDNGAVVRTDGDRLIPEEVGDG